MRTSLPQDRREGADPRGTTAMKPSTPARTEDPRDERRIAELVSGCMWMAAGAGGLLALALPGAAHEHLGWAVAVGVITMAWGAASFVRLASGATISITQRAVATFALMPVIAFALWSTGGVSSYIHPLMFLSTLYFAYFYPPKFAWPLLASYVAVFATPLLYDERAFGYPPRVLTFAIAVAGTTIAMQILKRRLLRAEERQRHMAERDPLTGLHNRRAFDAALDDQLTRGPAALVLFDFDGFKQVNDRHGHPTAAAVLCTVASVGREAIREVDHLARLGGDEFALIAPGAGAAGIERIVAALEEAIALADMPLDLPISATFAWALAPEDSADPDGLLRCADQRLLAGKRVRYSRA